MKLLKKLSNQKWLKTIRKKPIWHAYPVGIWITLIIGTLTIFFLFINMFTSFGKATPAPHMRTDVSFEHMQEFESVLAASVNSSVESGSPVEILTNGQEFLPDLLSEIEHSKESIYITDFIWDDGEFGATLFQSLIEKAKAGVRVYILLDGVSGRKAEKKYIQELTALGGKVAFFRPVRWWNVYRINGRTHVRDFVVDNKVAYIGGVAISDAWLGDAETSKSWHDFMFKMQGTMAERASAIFSNMWSQTTGEILPMSAFDAERQQGEGQFVSLFSSPAADMSSDMEHFIWLSIKAAQKSIHIQNPYALPSKSILEALETKAKAGVDVELLVPGKHTDSQYTRWASQSYYSRLLRAGVKIYEYQPSRIHTKTMTMDGVWSVIGSANLDNRSSEINLEAIMGVNDRSLAQDLEEKFSEDRDKSKEIVSDEWGRTSLLMSPVRFVSRLFARQF